jgi:hypothetical protein
MLAPVKMGRVPGRFSHGEMMHDLFEQMINDFCAKIIKDVSAEFETCLAELRTTVSMLAAERAALQADIKDGKRLLAEIKEHRAATIFNAAIRDLETRLQ